VLARLTGPGVVKQWARAPDMRVNSLPKFGPKSRKPAASFYRLFFYESVSNTF
jgi:hypothetical protein